MGNSIIHPIITNGGIRPADPFLIELKLLDEYCHSLVILMLIRFGEFISGFAVAADFCRHPN